jgi:hypothetical protein
MPVGFSGIDFEFTGNNTPEERAPPIHTRMTTERAIFWHRKLFCEYITFYIKSLPYGEVTVVRMEKSDTVSYLYQQFAANSKHGVEDAWLYIPHMKGCFSLDNSFFPASDLCNELDCGQQLLSSYHLTSNGSKVFVFHLTINHLEHSLGNMVQYIRMTLSVPIPPDYRVLFEYNFLPEKFQDDPLQDGLLSAVEVQLENQARWRALRAKQQKISINSKKGTINPHAKGLEDLLRKRQAARHHEMEKILALQEIKIIDGQDMSLQIRRASNDKMEAMGKMRRQRFRKLSLVGAKTNEKKGPPPENPFVALAMSRTAGGDDEDKLVYDDDDST